MRLVIAFMALALATLAAQAQDSALSGFMPTKDYSVTVNGKPVAAEVYQQGDRPAVLVVTSALPHPVMLDVRTGQVDSVNGAKIAKARDGSMQLSSGALGSALGTFSMAREGIGFTIQGRKVVLVHAAAAEALKKAKPK